jgi:hypothetical protein
MRFSKVRFNGARVEFAFIETEEGRTGGEKVTLYKNNTLPLPEFTAALQAFGPLVCGLLKLPAAYREEIKVVSVAMNWEEKDERSGCTVHATKEIAGANGPFNIHTPHLRQPLTDEETGATGFYDNEWAEAIEELITQAIRYINGQRSQADLFEGPKAA